MSSSRSKEQENARLSKYEGVCAGLTAMLEAVDELPPSGSPITPAVQTRVRQFFIQQISTANPTAGSSGSVSTGSKPLWVRPKDLQDTKQVSWQGCAALRAAIGLRIITHPQLAHVLFVACNTTAEAVSAAFKRLTGSKGVKKMDVAATRSYAWSQLQPYYVGSSSSSPPWRLSDDDLWDVLAKFVEVTDSCLPGAGSASGLVSGMQIKSEMLSPEAFSAFTAVVHDALAGKGDGPAAGVVKVVVPADSASSSSSASSGSSGRGVQAAAGKAAAGAGRQHAASDIDSSNTVDSSSRASSTKTVPDGSNNHSGSKRDADGSAVDVEVPATEQWLASMDTGLPLDDCPLLASFCSGMVPVVAAVADWQTAPSQAVAQQASFFAPLRAGIKHYASLQMAASDSGSSSSGSAQQGAGASKRRTIVPLYYPDNVFAELSFIPSRLAMLLQMLFVETPALQQHMEALPGIVQGVVKEVAKEQAVEKHSPAFKLLAQSAAVAGLAAMACAVVQAQVGITLRTEEQFLSALKQTCDACTKAVTTEADAGVTRSIAFNSYQILKGLTAPADSTGSNSSGSGSGSSGGGTGPGFAMPKCGLDVVYTVLDNFQSALVLMTECEGPMTRARALKLAPWDAAFNLASNSIEAILGPLSNLFESVKAADVAGDSKGAATGDQAADWGKGKGLAGLKGLFSGKPAESVPAAKPVAAKAHGSGVVAADSSASKAAAQAAPVKAATAQTAAAAADGVKQASPAAMVVSNSSSDSSATSVTPPDLLVEANLKRFYCSPDTFAFSAVEPLPEDSLELLVKLKLHTTYRFNGWNALHYACANHRFVLAKQLLDAGASVSELECSLDMQPLHLACLGRISDADEFYQLLDCDTLLDFINFVKQGGYADGRIAGLLLERGADASAGIGNKCAELAGITPLHILSMWTADQERGHDMIFGDAFVGKACHIWSISKTPSLPIRLSYALQDLAKAKAGQLGLRSCRMVNALDMVQDEDEALTKECEKGLDWDTKLHFALLHVTTAQGFLSYGANPNAQGGPQQDTPLMLAAGQGNAAMAALLLAAGADPEVMRVDGARALEIAAFVGYPRVGWALLCYGAQALPAWYVGGKPPPEEGPPQA